MPSRLVDESLRSVPCCVPAATENPPEAALCGGREDSGYWARSCSDGMPMLHLVAAYGDSVGVIMLLAAGGRREGTGPQGVVGEGRCRGVMVPDDEKTTV